MRLFRKSFIATKQSTIEFELEHSLLNDRPLDYTITSSSIIGRREEQQDRYKISEDKSFCCVMDGHGDSTQVVDYCHDNILNIFDKNRKKFKEPEKVVTRTLKSISDYVVGKKKKFSATNGTCLVSVYITESEIICHNIGDCRAVLCRSGVTIPLSFDHKPSVEAEKTRILKQGGKIDFMGYIYIPNNDRMLNMSRSIGDRGLRPCIISEPEVIRKERTENDSFIVLACDGIWEAMSSKQVVNYINDLLDRDKLTKEEITKSVLTRAGIRSNDNLTIIIVWFNNQ